MDGKDLLAGILLGLLSLVYLIAACAIPAFTGAGAAPLSARFFPFVYGGILIVLSICLIVRGVRNRRNKTQQASCADVPGTENGFRQSCRRNCKVILTFALLILYIALLQYVGFLICTFCYLLTQFFLFGQQAKEKWIARVFLAAALSVAIDYLFVCVFHVMLPKGLLGF